MNDFWLSCGHHLLDRDARGDLLITDQFLKAYFARPELVPPVEACAAERSLHAALLRQPRRAVSDSEIATLTDADARENWRQMLAFRDHLAAHESVEAAYRALMRAAMPTTTPPMFVDQLVHLMLRNILDDCEDALVLRAAELLFREQRLTEQGGSLIAADAETLTEMQAEPSPLAAMFGLAGPGE